MTSGSRMSPGVMELSRQDGDLRLSRDCVTNEKYSGEDLPGVARVSLKLTPTPALPSQASRTQISTDFRNVL